MRTTDGAVRGALRNAMTPACRVIRVDRPNQRAFHLSRPALKLVAPTVNSVHHQQARTTSHGSIQNFKIECPFIRRAMLAAPPNRRLRSCRIFGGSFGRLMCRANLLLAGCDEMVSIGQNLKRMTSVFRSGHLVRHLPRAALANRNRAIQ